MNFSDPAVTCTQTQAGDTQITCNINVGVTSGGTVGVTVTSQGYNASGFLGFPGGSGGTSAPPFNGDKQIPTSLSIVAGTNQTTSESGCTTSGGLTGCGVTRSFKYQVNDQSGRPIQVVNMPVGDVICNTATNQLNLQGYTTTCGGTTQVNGQTCWGTTGPCNKYTDQNGQLPENLPLCAPACQSAGACCTAGQTVTTQTWTIAGRALSSDVKSITYKCNNVLVNGN